MTKKGQLTVFIIIGILLILAVGIFLYAQRERALVPTEAEEIRLAEVPVEMHPLRDFIQSCVYTIAKDGLQKLGERGGYINSLQAPPFESTSGAAVQFAPGSGLTVPYWWHMSSRNNCVGDCAFTSEQPKLQRAQGGARSVEGQLDAYLAQELPSCFGEFEQFTEQEFTIIPAGELKPETRINRGNVAILLDYPLQATRAGQTFALKEFASIIPLDFFGMYQLANNITSLEAEHAFLERATRTLIDVFGRTNENALPPVSEMEFGFGSGTIWTKMDVEEKLMQLLTAYIPMLKVTHTRNYKFIPAPAGKDREFYEVLYNRGFTVPVLEPHRDLEVKFTYLPWWKPYLDLNCNGQLCQPEGISSTLGFLFGVRRYTFAYDASYPVLVEITNPGAYGGEGYSLRFFLETNLRNNEPLAKLEPLPALELREQSSLLCDPSQRTSGNITINVRSSSGQPVDGAEIIYMCGTETCHIGTSIGGKLAGRMPRCFNGLLAASHADYAPAVETFSAVDDSPATTDLVLGTPYEVDFSVKKWLLRKRPRQQQEGITGAIQQSAYEQAWDLDTAEPANQGPRETTYVMLERKNQEFEEPIVIVGDVCGAPFAKAPIPCGTPPTDNSKDILIYPGDYKVTIYSFMYPSPELQIPPERRCVSRGPFKKKKCFMVPPKAIIFSTEKPLMSGYAEYDWSVTDEQLSAAKEIEFTYINFALDKVLPAKERKIEDLEVMGSLFTYSEQYKDLLKPTIK